VVHRSQPRQHRRCEPAERGAGLLKANEELTAWLRGDRSMPFGPNHEHVTVRLIDFDNPENNQYVVASQFTFRAGPAERRADLVLLVNGFPIVLIEAKTPVRHAVSWLDGALQVHDDYEKNVPEANAAAIVNQHVAFNAYRRIVRQPGTDPLVGLPLPRKASAAFLVGNTIKFELNTFEKARAKVLANG
jgi:type I site-specific restriction-modification system R (restriction) subunit